MLRYLLDTNLCVRILRDRPQGALPRFNAEQGAICTSTIVLTELLDGAARCDRPVQGRSAVDRLVSRLDVLAFDDAAARHAADITARLSQAGQMIGSYDVLIAGHARSRGLVVVTGNLREFQRVDGLRCEDWLAQGGTLGIVT